MPVYWVDDAAKRSGSTPEFVTRMTTSGLIGDNGGYSESDVRRLQVLQRLERAGLPLEALAGLVNKGEMSLDFIDSAGPVFSPLEDATFAQLSEETGVSVEVLATVREAVGGSMPGPDELVSEIEMAVVPLIRLQHQLGFRDRAIQQALRVYGDSLRRISETEAEWFRTEIIQPMIARGASEDEVGRFAAEVSPCLSEVTDQAVNAIYHGQQGHAWLTNMIGGMADALERAGLHTVEQSVPAMCFLDITGYTHLTSERGDQAAADVAEGLRRVVHRPALESGGLAVKWLGDGVMFWFPSAGPGVVAAVEMVRGLEEEGLPPAHVGLHAGPVVFQEGDYYGNTVNVAARIGEFARPGEVLVSQDVVDRTHTSSSVTFREVGTVELKGVLEPMVLHEASPEIGFTLPKS